MPSSIIEDIYKIWISAGCLKYALHSLQRAAWKNYYCLYPFFKISESDSWKHDPKGQSRQNEETITAKKFFNQRTGVKVGFHGR